MIIYEFFLVHMNIKNNDFFGDFLQFETEKIIKFYKNMQILNQTVFIYSKFC